MGKIDVSRAPSKRGSDYPSPYDQHCADRLRRRLGDAGGLTDFGVNQLTLPPGVLSSQRHWHSHEDEFVFVISGEVVLVTDAGEETLRAGDCAAFKAGVADGHHLINRSAADAVVLEIGGRDPEHDRTTYSDIDMVGEPGESGYRRKSGQPIKLGGSES